MLLSLMTLLGYGLASRKMIILMSQPTIAKRVSRMIGLCFIGFGVLLLLTHRLP